MEKIKKVDFKELYKEKFDFLKKDTDPLYQIIEKLVLPHIYPKVSIRYIVTIHNGVRSDDENTSLTPKFVYVKIEDIFKVFDEMYSKFIFCR